MLILILLIIEILIFDITFYYQRTTRAIAISVEKENKVDSSSIRSISDIQILMSPTYLGLLSWFNHLIILFIIYLMWVTNKYLIVLFSLVYLFQSIFPSILKIKDDVYLKIIDRTLKKLESDLFKTMLNNPDELFKKIKLIKNIRRVVESEDYKQYL